MGIMNKLRAGLHRKTWEGLTPVPSTPNNGSFVVTAEGKGVPERIYYVNGTSSIWQYSPREDAWNQLSSSGIAGSYNTGACGEALGLGMLGGSSTSPLTAGTTTTMTTTRNLVRRIPGVRVRVVAGTGIGYEGIITDNSLGANAVLTVSPASAVAFDNTTVISVYSGSLWFFNSGISSVGFSVYDSATNAWTAKTVTGLPTAWGTCGQLVSTRSVVGSAEVGTSSGSNTTTTLNHTGKAWVVNGWSNYQVRITAGTGIGQIRTVASNTANALTVSAAWTVTPDATSVYSIEGNDDFLYLLGNNSIHIYRYSISANTWTQLAPTAARGAGLAAGGTADWLGKVKSWPVGAMATVAPGKQLGRFIYSLRGGGGSLLDIYDIALNTWVSAVPYGNQTETFNNGSCSCYDGSGRILLAKESTGRLFAFDVNEHRLVGLTTLLYPQSSTVAGDLLVVDSFIDGEDQVDFLYSLMHSRADFFRMLLI